MTYPYFKKAIMRRRLINARKIKSNSLLKIQTFNNHQYFASQASFKGFA